MNILSGFEVCTDCPLAIREGKLYCDHCPDKPRCQNCAIKHARYLKTHHSDVPKLLRRSS
jgi:hypothetical protein